MALLIENGYSESDYMYYLSIDGIGLDGFKLLDNQIKVDEMLREYEDNTSVRLSVMKGKRQQAIVPVPAVPAATTVLTDMYDEDEEYNIVPPVLFAINE